MLLPCIVRFHSIFRGLGDNFSQFPVFLRNMLLYICITPSGFVSIEGVYFTDRWVEFSACCGAKFLFQRLFPVYLLFCWGFAV